MHYVNLHTHAQSGNPGILEIVNQYPDELDPSVRYFSIGVHPWRINEKRLERDFEVLESKLVEKNCLAVGECGLDKRIDTEFEIQAQVFERQLLLAEKYRKPVIVHCVAAYQETIGMKRQLGISVPVIIHGFSKNAQVAKSLLDAGFYLSFGKWLLRNPELESVFQSVPDDRIFLETDTAEESIEEVYALAAKYNVVNMDEMKALIGRNVETVFGHDQSLRLAKQFANF